MQTETPEPDASVSVDRASGPALGPVRGCSGDDLASVFDLAVIGGGVYGVAALLEASRRNLRAVLLEADDFGGGVSWSSHRIIHGGLRYLQSLDIPRFRDSVRERRWFLDTFPDQIEPLGCIVPLTGLGTRRPSLFACAAAMNNGLNTLFGGRSKRIASAQLVHASRLQTSAPDVGLDRVRGVGYWQDGLMVSSERVLIGMLRHACDLGGRAIRDVRVIGAEQDSGIRLQCIAGQDREVTVRARRVINCAGPASGGVATFFGGTHAPLFEPLRAFNVLMDVEPRLGEAIALDAPLLDGRMLFIVPGPAGLAIGTFEESDDGHDVPTRSSVSRLLEAAAAVLGRSDFEMDRVSAVWSGRLPRAGDGSLTPNDRPVLVDHEMAGGLPGAYSVSGVKYTTARLIAEHAVKLAFPDAPPPRAVGPIREPVLEQAWLTTPPDPVATEGVVRQIVRDEAAQTVDDICRRRTAWYTSPGRLREVAHAIGAGLGLDADAASRAVDDSLRAACAIRD